MTDWVVDLDGVVWRGGDLVPGADEAIGRLAGSGPVWFCTNNSSLTRQAYGERLARLGLAGHGLITSAMAVGTLLSPGERVLACAGPGVEEAIVEAGAEVVGGGPADAVVVGFHRDVDHPGLTRAVRAVLGGARLLATNDDPLYPDRDGPAPGAGAILAAVERATGARAVVAGKPYPAMVALVASRTSGGWVVGDRPGTDGALAAALGRRFALVDGGGGGAVAADLVAADLVAADLAGVAERLVAEGR